MLLQYIINGLLIGIVYSMIGLGYSLLFGVARILNFAYGEYYMIASYLTFLFMSEAGLPFIWVLVLNIIIMFVLGVVLEKVLIQPIRKRSKDVEQEGNNIIIATFGLQVVLQNLARKIFNANPRGMHNYVSGSVELGSLMISKERIFTAGISVVIIAIMLLVMKYSKRGQALSAVADNREAAVLTGIDTNMIYALVFGVSSVLVGISGTLFLPLYSVNPTIGASPLNKAFSTTLMGGLGNIKGAIIAGPILGIIESLVAAYISAQMRDAVAFIFIIIILIMFPQGLGSILTKVKMRKGGLQR